MAKTTEELNIKITGNSARAKDALDKTKKAIGGVGDKAKRQNSLLKNFKQNWMGITAAVVGLVVVTKKLVSAYAVQEKAQRTLSAAMKQAGTFTEEAFQHNLDYASSLQKMTTFGDEAILGVQKMLTNFGVEGEMMDKLTEQTLNLAAAKGMDLKAAADLVAKSVGSSTNALTRYGIQVTGAVGSTERMETAVENIAKLFGGAAVAEADTFAGSVTQLKNVFGDLMETIGGIIAKFLKPLIAIMKTVVLVLDALPEAAKLAGIALVAAFTVGIIAAKLFGLTLTVATGGISLLVGAVVAGAILMAEHWDKVQFAFDVAWSAIKIGLLEAASFMLERIPVMFAPWFFMIDKVIAAINMFREENLKSLTEMTADVQASTEEQLAIEQESLDKILTAHKKVTEKKKKERDEQDAVVEESTEKQMTTFDRLLAHYDSGIKSVEDMYSAMIGKIEKAMDKFFDNLMETVDMYAEHEIQKARDVMEARIKAMEATQDAALTAFIAEHAYTKAMEGDEKERYDAMTADEKAAYDLKIQFDEDLAAFKKEQADELREAKTRQWEWEKETALKQVNIDTLGAIMEAYRQRSVLALISDIPFLIAQGSMVKSQIEAQTMPSFAQGGSFVTSGPQAIMVGDNPSGEERVDITPSEQGGAGITIMNLNVYTNDVDDMTNQIFEKAELAGARPFRRGGFG